MKAFAEAVSVEFSVEAFTEASVEETSVEASTTKFLGNYFHESFHGNFHGRVRGSFHKKDGSFHGSCGSFHGSDGIFYGSFHELPVKMKIVQVAPTFEPSDVETMSPFFCQELHGISTQACSFSTLPHVGVSTVPCDDVLETLT